MNVRIDDYESKELLHKVKQDLIEMFADYLDSDELIFDQANAKIKDPIKREESELHIRMAYAAFNEYKKTIIKI